MFPYAFVLYDFIESCTHLIKENGVQNDKNIKAADIWSLSITIRSSCSISGALLRSSDIPQRRTLSRCIHWPSLRSCSGDRVGQVPSWGELHCVETMFGPARTMQGDRCDLTRLRADRGHHWLCSWDQDGISNSVCHGRKRTHPLCGWIAPHQCQGRARWRHRTEKQTTCNHLIQFQQAATQHRIAVIRRIWEPGWCRTVGCQHFRKYTSTHSWTWKKKGLCVWWDSCMSLYLHLCSHSVRKRPFFVFNVKLMLSFKQLWL